MRRTTDDHLQGSRPPVAWAAARRGAGAPGRASHLSRSARALRLLETVNTTPLLRVRVCRQHSPSLRSFAMMGPPPKRLRILQSVEVDESSPDYIAAQQKQQERFKGTLESIFAKYGSMHESQSDEIDIMKGNVVVNRGHLRRAARHGTLTASGLLNSVAAGDVPVIGEDSDEEGDSEDSEDELAPTQPNKSSAQKDNHAKRAVPLQAAQSSPAISTPVPVQAQTPRTVSVPIAQIVPFTPDPAANLLQHIQFPQTPAGQQAQTSFYTALTQTINQAVQQAVAPLFSSILPPTSMAQSPLTNVPPPQTIHADTVDTLAAARDPKWFFPPLPYQAREDLAARCRSVSKVATSSTLTDVAGHQEHLVQEDNASQDSPGVTELPEQSTISVSALVRSQEPANIESRTSTRRSSPRVEIQHSSREVQQSNKPRGRTKWVFSEADEIYIAKRRTLHGDTFDEIRNSKKKWEIFPSWVFQQRYAKRFHPQQLHLKDTPELEDAQETPEAECNALPIYHLPTPSSLEQEDTHAHDADAPTSPKEHVLSSSTHFDEDERDLLSLASDDLANEQLQFESAAEDISCPDADEIILPSVELTDMADDEALQQGHLAGSPFREACAESAVKIKEEPGFSSPSNKRKRPQIDFLYQAIPDTESEAGGDDNANEDSNYHGSNAHPTPKRPKHKSPSLDLVGDHDDDELQAITPTITTYIKREFSTPVPTNFLLCTPAPQSRAKNDLPSSGVKSSSAQSRRKLHNDSKRAWAKKTPVGKLATRRSLHTEPRKAKRTWDEVEGGSGKSREESVDPLAP